MIVTSMEDLTGPRPTSKLIHMMLHRIWLLNKSVCLQQWLRKKATSLLSDEQDYVRQKQPLETLKTRHTVSVWLGKFHDITHPILMGRNFKKCKNQEVKMSRSHSRNCRLNWSLTWTHLWMMLLGKNIACRHLLITECLFPH